jgi:hypothetical protein
MLAVCEKHTPKQHSSFLKSCMEFRGNIFDFLKSSNLKVYCPEHISIYIYMWQCGIAIVIAISIYIYIFETYLYCQQREKKDFLDFRPAIVTAPSVHAEAQLPWST